MEQLKNWDVSKVMGRHVTYDPCHVFTDDVYLDFTRSLVLMTSEWSFTRVHKRTFKVFNRDVRCAQK